MMLLKVFLLVWYFSTKIIFRMIKLIFSLKINFKNGKYPIFDCPQSSCLKRYKNILWVSSFGCKNLLNFICHSLKFHNCHHTTVHKVNSIEYLLIVIVTPIFRNILLAEWCPIFLGIFLRDFSFTAKPHDKSIIKFSELCRFPYFQINAIV